jgi:RNA polymerase sigma factor (sigma-70 family)
MMEALLAEYEPTISKVAAYHFHKRSMWIPSLELGDLIQAGRIALVEAARQHDPVSGATFKTYFHIRLRGAVMDEIRLFQRESRYMKGVVHESFDLDLHDAGAEDDDPVLRDEVLAAMARLNDRERVILTQRLMGASLDEIGAQWVITESRACRIIQQAAGKVAR